MFIVRDFYECILRDSGIFNTSIPIDVAYLEFAFTENSQQLTVNSSTANFDCL